MEREIFEREASIVDDASLLDNAVYNFPDLNEAVDGDVNYIVRISPRPMPGCPFTGLTLHRCSKGCYCFGVVDFGNYGCEFFRNSLRVLRAHSRPQQTGEVDTGEIMSLLLKDVQKGNPAYNKIRDLILGMIDPLAFIVVSILPRRPSVLGMNCLYTAAVVEIVGSTNHDAIRFNVTN
ncbi:hypothetical protein L916_00562 [Phytophthora nicotianae]|uniref:Uncharacterized protein n=1 Tax=Phytophthora nicotianae TaxID=4792 RepID=W2JX11_PHYNI|nr:hypothetical protein L916_00562 [Phytophthora nicotianae]